MGQVSWSLTQFRGDELPSKVTLGSTEVPPAKGANTTAGELVLTGLWVLLCSSLRIYEGFVRYVPNGKHPWASCLFQ